MSIQISIQKHAHTHTHTNINTYTRICQKWEVGIQTGMYVNTPTPTHTHPHPHLHLYHTLTHIHTCIKYIHAYIDWRAHIQNAHTHKNQTLAHECTQRDTVAFYRHTYIQIFMTCTRARTHARTHAHTHTLSHARMNKQGNCSTCLLSKFLDLKEQKSIWKAWMRNFTRVHILWNIAWPGRAMPFFSCACRRVCVYRDYDAYRHSQTQ